MINLHNYIKYMSILHNISFDDMDKNVLNYVLMFDNIDEEPLFKYKDLVLYVSKHNNKYNVYYEVNSNQIGKKINLDTCTSTNDIFNKIKQNLTKIYL